MKSSRNKFSLIKRVQHTYILIIALMIVPTIYSVVVSNIHSRQYNDIITNVSLANLINSIAKKEIPDELWNIVSGRKSFNEGMQYEMLEEIKDGLSRIEQTTSDKRSRQKLEVASRARLTLYRNVSRLGVNIASGGSVASSEVALDEIRSISALFSDIMQEFIVMEIESAYKTNISISNSSIVLGLIQAGIILFAVILSLRGGLALSDSVRRPISEMEILSTKIAHGDFDSRVNIPGVLELDNLADNLNSMAQKIDALIKQNVEEQKNLRKAEMKALQAQITPHFLYNTFDTIIWLAEEEQTEDVIKVTHAFSEFLRISLSRGHEWITVGQELDHVRNYLTIQKIRYADILNYEIEADPALNDFKMLKLSLQPLVENAIYHGIKNKRGRGHLKVSAHFSDASKKFMTFTVQDDGAGFSQERLEQVRHELSLNSCETEKLSSVYGLYNVNQRLVLYYNDGAEPLSDGIQIESTGGFGAKISFTVPCIVQEADWRI